MKKCIDAALRLFCAIDDLRAIMCHPFVWNGAVVATEGHYLLRVRGYGTMEYNNDDETYGKRPNIDAVMRSEYNTHGYLNVDKLKDYANDYSVQIGGHRTKGENIQLLIDASGLLGVDRWAVDTSCNALILHTDDGKITIMIMPWQEEGKLIELDSEGYSEVHEDAAHKYFHTYEDKARKAEEEEKRKYEEYMQNHHKIWKIYVKRTETGVLLVDAPTYEDAMRIAERNSDDAELEGDYEYEVDEDDYEEDVDHDEIQNEYSRNSIATMEETKWGNKFISVDDYPYFDDED